jgi:serine/threonine-protein kinase
MRENFAARNYELIGELGRGGMGVVYLARDTKLGRRVALKTLAADRQGKPTSVMRFEREAKTFAAIRHPHIATLYEFSDDKNFQFLALEYIEGTDLESERRRGRRWQPLEVALLIQHIAEALDHTHAKGVLHRDIKPGNILIERNTNRVVLTDFGLAKGQNDITLTAAGYAVGTPAYMAPEQITDSFNVKPDGRSDLFALGTVAYEMLTGRHPFLGNDDMATMRAIVQKDPAPPRSHNPEIPEQLDALVMAMLAKHPDKRPATGRAVADALIAIQQACRSGEAKAQPTPRTEPAAPSKAAAPQPIPPSSQSSPPGHIPTPVRPETVPPRKATVAPPPPAAPPASAIMPTAPAPSGVPMKTVVIIAVAVAVVAVLLTLVIVLALRG